MKKITLFLIAFFLTIGITIANPVTPGTAKTVAINFYTQNLTTQVKSATLAYTEKNSDGSAVYYVFDINENDGFVIVTADDALRPIIGYSNKGHFVIPAIGSNFNYWMQK